VKGSVLPLMAAIGSPSYPGGSHAVQLVVGRPQHTQVARIQQHPFEHG
jgi:hypothetical protein